MKKLKYLSVFIISILLLTGCGNENLIEDLDIEEGCYNTSDNAKYLICFTKDKKYYDVFNTNGKYYRDPIYRTSTNEETKYSSKFEIDKGIITLEYYENGTIWQALVCSSQSDTTMSCTETSNVLGKVETAQKQYTKVEKEFTKEIIENLPIYERNKEFELIFNGKKITCNMTRSYSITGILSGTVISACLKKTYNENYNVTQLDSTGNWQIFSNSVSTKANSYGNQKWNYIISNYSYNVTVNGKTFGYGQAFPIDPFTSNEKMIVNITKK